MEEITLLNIARSS